MENFDTAKLDALLAEKKYDEARALIAATLAGDLSDAQKGALYLYLINLQLEMTNKADAEYLGTLNDILESVKGLDQQQNRFIDESDLANLREELKK